LNNPYYKVVVADKRSPRDGKFIEIIGNYDPKKAGENSHIALEPCRILDWPGRAAKRHRSQPDQKGEENG